MDEASQDRRSRIEAKLEDFCHRFRHGYWDGPFFHSPEAAVALGKRIGMPAPAEWEVWLAKSGVSDSLGRGLIGVPLRAAIHLPDDEVLGLSQAEIARRLAAAVAGHEAHEALEFSRFDDERVVNPHGSAAELEGVGQDVTTFLMNAATTE
jgi:hypothetical protein